MPHQTATVIASVKTTKTGAHVRLNYYGQSVASIPVPVQQGETPTEAADHALAEHGWRAVEPWQVGCDASGPTWLAYVDRTEET